MEKKIIKIAILSAFSGCVSRGAETFVHELANNLIHLGDDVSVYQTGSKLKYSKYKTISLAQNRHIPLEGKIPFFNPRSFFILKFTWNALQKLDSDTQIVIPTNGQWQTLLTKIWCVFHHKKMIISGQSGPGLDDRINIMCFPDYFVALSTPALNKAKSDNRFVRSMLIPNGVDRTIFSPKQRRMPLSVSDPIVLCVAALIKQKQVHLVIEAVSKLSKVNLLIVGSGILKNDLLNLCEEKLSKRYQFLELSHDQMPGVYTAANVFTLVPETSESFGIVFVEALSANVPVVTGDDAARREIVGNAGMYVKDPTNADEYASLLQKALRNDWKSIPREQSLQFDWSNIAKQYQELFRTICQ